MKRKNSSSFSFNLAFLDIMFCGFGAVVLLVLIINSQILTDNKIKDESLVSEIEKIEVESKAMASQYHEMLRLLEKNSNKAKEIQQELTEIDNKVKFIERKKIKNSAQSKEMLTAIDDLKKDINTLDKYNEQRNKTNEISLKTNENKIRQYEGAGHRQYLTGLKLGGKRILILIDSSASMLDETIVNIIVKRNLPDKIKKLSHKWQQAIETVKWLVANLPKESQFLIVSFNDSVLSLANEQSYQWIKTSDNRQMNTIFKKLGQLVPKNGTNLIQAFSMISRLSDKPDNIILITDGLPTLGNIKNNKSKISPAERITLFGRAIKKIPPKIPVNTILLAMEGDPMAASLFWELAINSNGSFMTPSQDWP